MKLLLETQISKGLKYHLDTNRPLISNVYRYSSEEFLNLYRECRQLYNKGYLLLEGMDREIVEQTDLGEYGTYNGTLVPLDLPLDGQDPLLEATYRGRFVQLERPQKVKDTTKFFVFVRNPRTKRVVKVRFGSALGGWLHLPTEMHNPESRAKMAKKLKCTERFDKMTAVYWTCRLPQFWYWLGGLQNFPGFW